VSEHLHAVLRDGVVESVVVMDPATAREFDRLGVFPGARYMDVTDLETRPGIGWTLSGTHWVASPQPELPPAPEPGSALGPAPGT